jgi:hypothetical protein
MSSMHYSIAALLLHLSAPAFATPLPEIPEEALGSASEEARQDWEARQSAIDRLEEEIDIRRDALERVAETESRADLKSAKADSREMSDIVRAEVDASRADVEQARHALAGAKQQLRISKQDRSLAKTRGDRVAIIEAREAVSRAKHEVAGARGDLATTERELTRTERDADTQMEEVEQAVVTARTGSGEPAEPSLEQLELASLEAQLDHEIASLALARAEVANEGGAGLDLTPFVEAEAAARAAHEAAVARLQQSRPAG